MVTVNGWSRPRLRDTVRASMARKRGANMDGRAPPKRFMERLEAIQHLLHASIRMFFWEEDPFALHVIIHSCNRLLTDYAKKKNIFLTFDWRDVIRTEYHQAFLELRLETYDFLRHADRRPDQKIGVRDIAKTNEVDLLMNIHSYLEITKNNTEHTQQFMKYLFLIRPEYYKSAAPVATIEEARRELRKYEHHKVMEEFRKALAASAAFQREREQDFCDLGRVRPLKA
jgi:hypothetical protein